MNYTFNVKDDKELFTEDSEKKLISEKHKELLKKYLRKRIKENKNKKIKVKEATISMMSVDDAVDGMSELVGFIVSRKPNMAISADIIANAFTSAIANNIDPEKQKAYMKRILRYLMGFYKTL